MLKLYIRVFWLYGCRHRYLICLNTRQVSCTVYKKCMREEFLTNKVFKVIWNEARNAYVVVSEIAKNHGSKSCSTKKLLAMLIATGVMTCASFDVLAAEPSGTDTAKS